MLINVINSNESILVLEINNRIYKINSNETCQIEIDSLDFNVSAHLELIDSIDLELDKKKIKSKIIQKLFDKLVKFGKQVMAQIKVTYNVKMSNPKSPLEFIFTFYEKDTNILQDLLEIPEEAINFARLECESANISVVDCEVINKKKYLQLYRRLYWWINWSNGLIFGILFYLPIYTKQKIIISKHHLKKRISGLYRLSKAERDKLNEVNDD